MNKESIQGPLSALRNAGTVCGVCLSRGPEILINLFPFSEARVSDMTMAMDDIQTFFKSKGRRVDQMSFGYDGGCATLVEDGEYRLVVMHMLADEVDFIAKAARAFLADFQLNLFAEQISAGNTRLTGLIPPVPSPEEPPPAQPKTEPMKRATPKPAPAPVPAPKAQPATPEAAPKVEPEPAEEVAPTPEAEQSAEWVPELKELSGPPATMARLSAQQPESTLPPPRKPKAR